MKHNILAVLFYFCILLFFCSCSVNFSEESESDTNYNSITRTETKDLQSHAKPVLNNIFQYTTPYNISVIDFNKDIFFLNYNQGLGDNKSNNTTHTVYNLKTNKSTEIGKTENELTSSGANVIMGHCKYYWYNTVDNSGREINKLIKSDGKNNKLETIKEESLSRQLLRLNKLSETEFITTYYSNDDKNTFTTVKIYDTTQKTFRNIINLQYTNDENKPNSSNIVLETVCAMDNKIYGIGREKKDFKYEYFVYSFDKNGKLIEKISANALADTLNSSVPVQFQIIGNYFAVSNYQTEWSLYKIDGNKITCIIPASDGYMFALGNENTYSSQKSPYFYYYKRDNGDGSENRYLYIFDTTNGNKSKAEIKFDENYRSLNYISTDEEGNLLFCFDKDFSKFDYKYYYLDNTSIKNSMKN